jgi:hypothetical protein
VISTLDAFENSDPPVRYTVGVRMRRQKEVNMSVLDSRKQWLYRQAAESVRLIAETVIFCIGKIDRSSDKDGADYEQSRP